MNDPDIGTFDRFARLYDLAMPRANERPLAEGLARARRPVHRALDVGGGTGRAAAAVRPETVVVDASLPMLRRARAKGQGAVAGDAARLPVADGAVDAVVVVDALHHIPDHPAVFGELARVLRPGGVAVVREFDPTTLRGRLLVAGEHAWGFASTFHPPEELAAGLAAAGLEASVLEGGFGYTVVGVAPDDHGDSEGGDGESPGEKRRDESREDESGRHKSAGTRAGV